MITAANGDTLEIEHYSTYGVDPVEGVSAAEGVASIIGGIGRFAGAPGDLSEMAKYHFANEMNYSTTTGHIVHDASIRAPR